MRLPGRHVLYALSGGHHAGGLLQQRCSWRHCVDEHESDKPTRNCGDRYRLTDTGSAERANRDLD